MWFIIQGNGGQRQADAYSCTAAQVLLAVAGLDMAAQRAGHIHHQKEAQATAWALFGRLVGLAQMGQDLALETRAAVGHLQHQLGVVLRGAFHHQLDKVGRTLKIICCNEVSEMMGTSRATCLR